LNDKVSFTALMTVAMTLISVGIQLINQNQALYGIVLIIVAVALIYVSVYMYEKGIITEIEKRIR